MAEGRSVSDEISCPPFGSMESVTTVTAREVGAQVEPLERSVHCVRLNALAADKPPLKYVVVPRAPESLKIGRQNTPKTTNKITDGYFDSRVLSRNHAELFMRQGALYIRDLKSSNGTFLNGEKLAPLEDYVLRVGDKVDLGTTLESQMAHKKISCVVGSIDFVSLDAYNTTVGAILDEGDMQSKRLELFTTSLDAILFGETVEESLVDLLAPSAQEAVDQVKDSTTAKTTDHHPPVINQLVLALANEQAQQQRLKAMARFIKNYSNALVARDSPHLWTSLDGELRGLAEQYDHARDELQKTTARMLDQDRVIEDQRVALAELRAEVARVQSESEKVKETPQLSHNTLALWGVGLGLLGGVSLNYILN